MGKKRCKVCGEVKGLEQFYKAAGCVDGRRGECRDCFQAKAVARADAKPELRERGRQRTRQWIADNEERYRDYKRAYGKLDKKKRADRRDHLKRKFGLTLEDYDALLAAQHGGCAICGDPPAKTALHVDHDHETGVVRGLLCFRCNAAIGNLRDDQLLGPAIIRRAAFGIHVRNASGSALLRHAWALRRDATRAGHPVACAA